MRLLVILALLLLVAGLWYVNSELSSMLEDCHKLRRL